MKMTIDEFVSHDSGEVLKLKAKVKRYEKALKEIFKLLPIGLGLLHKLSEPIAKISLIINDALREALSMTEE